MFEKLMKKLNKKSAQGLVEYTLILALVVVICIVILKALGGSVQNSLSAANSGLAAGTTGS